MSIPLSSQESTSYRIRVVQNQDLDTQVRGQASVNEHQDAEVDPTVVNDIASHRVSSDITSFGRGDDWVLSCPWSKCQPSIQLPK